MHPEGTGNGDRGGQISPSFLEKVSFKWWKRLTDVQRSIVQQRGLLNLSEAYAKESRGIHRGNLTLIKKHRINLMRSTERNVADEAGAAMMLPRVRRFSQDTMIATGALTPSDIAKGNMPGVREQAKQQAKLVSFGGFAGLMSGAEGTKKTLFGAPVRSTGGIANATDYNKLNLRDKIHARRLIVRHEIDELRSADAMMNGKAPALTSEGHPIQGALRFGGHMGPEVILRESNNIAGAGPRVRKIFEQMRSLAGEAKDLKDLNPKFNYGRYQRDISENSIVRTYRDKHRPDVKAFIDRLNTASQQLRGTRPYAIKE
jgi:hypothetical protein